VLRNPVAVEKLGHSDFAKIGSRQEALQAIFRSLLDIFYYPIFGFFQKNRLLQQPPLFSTVIPVAQFKGNLRSIRDDRKRGRF
jgi:hypothetical protein